MCLWSGKGRGWERRRKGGEHKPQLPHRIHKIARMQQHQPAICTKVFIQQIRIQWSSIKCSLAKTILIQFTLQKTSATSNQPEVAQGADYRRTTYPQFSSWNRKPPGAKLTWRQCSWQLAPFNVVVSLGGPSGFSFFNIGERLAWERPMHPALPV